MAVLLFLSFPYTCMYERIAIPEEMPRAVPDYYVAVLLFPCLFRSLINMHGPNARYTHLMAITLHIQPIECWKKDLLIIVISKFYSVRTK
jgi:hypothetical protein